MMDYQLVRRNCLFTHAIELNSPECDCVHALRYFYIEELKCLQNEFPTIFAIVIVNCNSLI